MQDGNVRQAQRVSDLRLFQAGSVVFERQAIEVLVHAESPQTVDVRELAEGAKLLGTQRALQFVGYFDQGHTRIIAIARPRFRTTSSNAAS